MKPKVLFVGEHPHGVTGNSNMMMELLNRVDYSKFDVSVYAGTRGLINNPFKEPLCCQVIEGGLPGDTFVRDSLITLLEGIYSLDILVFVGIDIWACADIMNGLVSCKRKLGFKIVSIFPYDLVSVREDWIEMLSPVDFPCVYSEYGFRALKDRVPNLRYFRPPLYKSRFFKPIDQEVKKLRQKDIFQITTDDSFILGFFGANQIRKDPQRLIKAFYLAKKDLPNLVLYLHTSMHGQYNLDQYLDDCGKKHGDVFTKIQGKYYDTEAMAATYNSVDCVISASYQEGLNWTVVEAMLCGVPVIASNTTAHTELLTGGAGLPVRSDTPVYLPVITKKGCSWVDALAVNVEEMAEAIKRMATNSQLRKSYIERGLARGKEWVAGESDINELLKDATRKNVVVSSIGKESVLFAQHSSAGDVLMTTRCLKDIKQRHPDMTLTYMTMPQYMDIVTGNPYIDSVIPWEDKQLSLHRIVYNPHGERILPGHWGRNSNSLLSDFYWKILMIKEPCDFYIGETDPPDEIKDKIIRFDDREIVVLHTTGGDPEFRTYEYMADVAKELWRMGYYTIQIGGKADYPAGAMLDLRGKLTFRQTAYVVSYAMWGITVDSYVSHLLGAMGISQICLFGSGNCSVVRPNQTRGKLICRTPDYTKYCLGLGPCSAGVRDCPVKCTGVHDPKDIIKDFCDLVGNDDSVENTSRIDGPRTIVRGL